MRDTKSGTLDEVEDRSRMPGMARKKPTKPTRLYVNTAADLQIIEEGTGVSPPEYVEKHLRAFLDRDLPKARKLKAKREELGKEILPAEGKNGHNKTADESDES
jgi:hypothetical protein